MRRLFVAVIAVVFVISAFNGAEAAKKTKKKAVKAAAKEVTQGTELDQLRAQMTSKVDEIEGVKWIYDKTTRKLLDSGRNKTYFYVYLGQDQDSGYIWPRLVMGFTRSDWVFFESVIINNDGDKVSLDFGYFAPHRDSGYGQILEQIDLSGAENQAIIKKVIESKKTMIRFKGKNYAHDFTLPDEQRAALARIWRLYELMRK